MTIAEDLTGQKRPAKQALSGKEKLRTLTVEVLLILRKAYLSTPNASPLKLREILPNRCKAALRTTQTPQEWATRAIQNLGIKNLDKYQRDNAGSQALTELVDFVESNDMATEWRAMFLRELDYWFSLTWLAAEKEKEAAIEAKKANGAE